MAKNNHKNHLPSLKEKDLKHRSRRGGWVAFIKETIIKGFYNNIIIEKNIF